MDKLHTITIQVSADEMIEVARILGGRSKQAKAKTKVRQTQDKQPETVVNESYFNRKRSDVNRFDPTSDDPAYTLTPEKSEELADKVNSDPEVIARRKQWLKDRKSS